MTIPTLGEIFESVKSDLRSKLNVSTLIGKSVLLAFAGVQAAKLKLIYTAVSQINKNIFVDTCDYDTIKRYGMVKLNRLPNAAIAGEYNVVVTGSIGAIIERGTTFKSFDTSNNPDKLFVVDTQFTFASTTGTIPVRSLEAGVGALLNIGDTMQITSPLLNVDSVATVDSIITTPVEEEDIEEYRIKVIAAYRTEPQGGAKIDYMQWSSDAAGVRRVYPYVVSGSPGDIKIYVEATVGDSIDSKGTPPPSMLDDVVEVIELSPDTTLPMESRGRRPMGVFGINIIPVVLADVDIVIVGLSPSVSLASIENAIVQYLYDIRPYIDGADIVSSQNDRIYEADIYRIVRDVLSPGETFTSLSMTIDGTPYSLYVFDNGIIPTLNSVTV